MDAKSNELHVHLLAMADWLAVWNDKGNSPRFREETLGFLTHPIELETTLGTIHANVLRIEENYSKYYDQISCEFRLSRTPAPADFEPAFGADSLNGALKITLKIGETSGARTIYGFTFISLNTFDENHRLFRDFAIHQWLQENDFDPLLDE